MSCGTAVVECGIWALAMRRQNLILLIITVATPRSELHRGDMMHLRRTEISATWSHRPCRGRYTRKGCYMQDHFRGWDGEKELSIPGECPLTCGFCSRRLCCECFCRGRLFVTVCCLCSLFQCTIHQVMLRISAALNVRVCPGRSTSRSVILSSLCRAG